jgi:hypothetical protein
MASDICYVQYSIFIFEQIEEVDPSEGFYNINWHSEGLEWITGFFVAKDEAKQIILIFIPGYPDTFDKSKFLTKYHTEVR